MSVLITGGAGFIGSVVVDSLVDRGERVVVLDDLSGGHRDAVNEAAEWQEGIAGNADLVGSLVDKYEVEACVHFAGLIAVGESVREPHRYLDVNVGQSLTLFRVLADHGVERVVFSSSAAVYGDPEKVPIPEDHRCFPTSPYGLSKLLVERALGALDERGLVRSASLRYFNAAGASERRWERHDPETHLVPLAIDAVLGRRDPLVVFGDDYPTPDGTPIRDYIHVEDLAAAHVAALDHLAAGGGTFAANLGNGSGYSVLEVMDSVGRSAGRPVPYSMGPRRSGDPARLVAAVDRARERLDWAPAVTSLDEIVSAAWLARERNSV